MDRIEMGIGNETVAIERYGSTVRVYVIEKEQIFDHDDVFGVETYIIDLLNEKAAKAGLSKEYFATWVKDQVSRII